jgi:hypothetical protein
LAASDRTPVGQRTSVSGRSATCGTIQRATAS